MLCTDQTFVNADDISGTLKGLRCKRWDCEICRPYNRQKVMHIAKAGKPNLFLTLTCDPARYSTPAEAARDMVRGLVLFRRKVKRRFGVDKLPFIVVFEKTKRGWPHMHLLLRAPFMHWKILRALWLDTVGAFQVDVRFIKKSSQVLFYVTKYIGKDLEKFEGCKRWWRSQNYNVLTEQKPELVRRGLMFTRIDWEFTRLLAKLEADGWQFSKEGRHRVEARPPPSMSHLRFDGALLRSVGYTWAP